MPGKELAPRRESSPIRPVESYIGPEGQSVVVLSPQTVDRMIAEVNYVESSAVAQELGLAPPPRGQIAHASTKAVMPRPSEPIAEAKRFSPSKALDKLHIPNAWYIRKPLGLLAISSLAYLGAYKAYEEDLSFTAAVREDVTFENLTDGVDATITGIQNVISAVDKIGKIF